ncbi:alpha/beta hydrolase [Pararhizobium mangrovi]|uniref:Alpha/beta hydrolase n=1 Tax=Pararhizobium mangrovi TaxID=2590452 RepID=A0A506UA39_9HYPH|nr:alpha/beta hydrolase fold domain-containing protein [Pararhizobium mangrovi]TPW30226.1 alpha/beta hydrolase [Pararhizobium mangrovi]
MAKDEAFEALLGHIEAHPVEGDVASMRATFETLAPPPVEGRWVTIGGIECLQIGPGEGPPVVWLHGGGLVFGSPQSHSAMAAYLARTLSRPVILPRYRLAPEHAWPAPFEDVLALLDAVDDPIDLVGDSAGGHLALLAAQRRPHALRSLSLISPNTDRTGASTTRVSGSKTDAMNDDASDLRLARMAFGAELATLADASPLHGDLSNLPPVWITTTTSEVLLDDSLLLIAALGRAGVSVEADIRRGLCHLWPLWPDRLPAARSTIERLARSIERRS